MPLQKINKITQAEMSSKGVSALANKPNSHSAQYGHSGLSATELKAWFDKLGILLSSRLNDMIDMLAKAEACEHIAIPSDLLPQQEGDISLLDFLKAFANGCMAHNIFVSKNEGSSILQSLQSLLFEINKKTSQNSEAVENQDKMISDLTTLVYQNAEAYSSNSKDAEGNIVSHKEILGEIEEVRIDLESIPDFVKDKVTIHNEATTAHLDIRTNIATAIEKAQEAYNLAAGKSKVHPMSDFDSFKNSIETQPERYNVGDVFMFKDKLLPDLILFEKDVVFDSSIDDFYLDDSPAMLEMEPGMTYFLYGNRFVSVESGMDISKFTTRDEHLSDVLSLNNSIACNSEKIQLFEENYATKEEVEKAAEEVSLKACMVGARDETSTMICLQSGYDYDFGVRQTLILDLPDERGEVFEVIFAFIAGSTDPVFDAPAEIYFSGDDTLNGMLYPVCNRAYEVNIKTVCGILWARVGAIDYHIIEA